MATLRRELRRDAATGHLPLAWDGDDWGQAAQQAWRAWLLQTLSIFETSSGHTEWATTAARPGVGAQLSDAPRQTVAARVQVRGVPKQLRQAVERALKEALVR